MNPESFKKAIFLQAEIEHLYGVVDILRIQKDLRISTNDSKHFRTLSPALAEEFEKVTADRIETLHAEFDKL